MQYNVKIKNLEFWGKYRYSMHLWSRSGVTDLRSFDIRFGNRLKSVDQSCVIPEI